MTKKRTSIPQKTREAVLSEYSHHCAVCGGDHPQLHHIDETPSNHDKENLLPLCPNCHLNDIHNPTVPIHVEKLKLFRKYKDPYILKPKFEPIFRRFRFMFEVDESDDSESYGDKVSEGIEFLKQFEMGEFYAKELKKLIYHVGHFRVSFGGYHNPAEDEYERKKSRRNHIKMIQENRDQAFFLIVEMIRYQKWN